MTPEERKAWKDNYYLPKDVNELISRIKIIDNLLPDYDQEYFFNNYNFFELESTYTQQREYIGENISKIDKIYGNLIEKIVINSNLRLKEYSTSIKNILTNVLLVSDYHSAFRKHRHIDDSSFHENGFTLSYHWMGDENAGGTVFYEDFNQSTPLLQIPFKPNRLVIFPACIPHEGYSNPRKKYEGRRVIMALFTELE